MRETADASPSVPAEFAAAAARLLDVDVVRIRQLGGEWNRTFRIDTADGRSATVKVVPDDPAERAQLNWQHGLLDRCADHSGLPTPTVLRGAAGADAAPVRLSARDWLLSCYTWLPGQIVGDMAVHSRELLTEWGRIAGRFMTVLDGLDPPRAVRQTHDWDLLAAPQNLERQLGAIDAAHRRQATTVLGWYSDVVVPLLPQLPRSVVHHDLNDHNVLARVDSDGRQRITGVIDFTDALVSARVSEIAIAGGYAMLRKSDPIAALAAVLGGAAEVVELTESELAAFYPMAALRLVLNGVTWTARSSVVHGDYGRQRSQHTWATLAQLVEHPPADVLPFLLKNR